MKFLEKLLNRFKPKRVYRCLSCGKILHGEESISRGYGPNCWRKKQGTPRIKRRLLSLETANTTEKDVVETATLPFIVDPLPRPVLRMDPQTGQVFEASDSLTVPMINGTPWKIEGYPGIIPESRSEPNPEDCGGCD
jgi:hypothetical protein